MSTLDSYIIGYPQIVHPLMAESVEFRQQYCSLLRHYAGKYCDDYEAAEYKIQMLINSLFKDGKYISLLNINDNKSVMNAVMKTRFRPFTLYSYRYIFLFDCLLLFAVDSRILGKHICDELKTNVNKRYHQALDNIVNQLYFGGKEPAKNSLITAEMYEAWNVTREYTASINRNITFTATMSAGKSTLINGIIGRELSYAKKAACTSTVMKIFTSPSKSELMNIFCDGKLLPTKREHDVREFTKGLTTPCSISGYFLSSLSKRKFTLIDTPGVNSSLNPEHKTITRNELSGADTDVVVYVIPVENYGSEDDFDHLKFINKKASYNQIVFAVNMMDSCDFEDDSVDEIISDVREHLIKIGYADPIVCPMSAKAGLLIKQALYGDPLSDNDQEACKTYVDMFQKAELNLARFYPIPAKEKSINDISWLQTPYEKVWTAFMNTGLPGFETLLLSYGKFDVDTLNREADEQDLTDSARFSEFNNEAATVRETQKSNATVADFQENTQH